MTSVQEEVSALVVAQRWSEWLQLNDGDNEVDRGDSGAMESLTISLKQNKTQELVEIWESWDQSEKSLFYQEIRDIVNLLCASLVWVMLQSWNSGLSSKDHHDKKGRQGLSIELDQGKQQRHIIDNFEVFDSELTGDKAEKKHIHLNNIWISDISEGSMVNEQNEWLQQKVTELEESY
ncbi:hypothetical protein V6N13_133730 [Hibiscus sabdariffa]